MLSHCAGVASAYNNQLDCAVVGDAGEEWARSKLYTANQWPGRMAEAKQTLFLEKLRLACLRTIVQFVQQS